MRIPPIIPSFFQPDFPPEEKRFNNEIYSAGRVYN